MCDKCGIAKVSVSHMLWSCPDIFGLPKQYGVFINLECNLEIFGSYDGTRALPFNQRQLLREGIIAAKNIHFADSIIYLLGWVFVLKKKKDNEHRHPVTV